MLVYGDPGSGKTWLLGTAQDHPDTSPVLVIDVDGGLTTLKKRTNLDTKKCRSIAELQQYHNDLYTDNNGYYKTVAVDNLTELQKMDMRFLMEKAHEKNSSRDKDEPSQAEWTKSGERIRKIVRAFRDLPMHVIFTAHQATEKDEVGTVAYYPDLPGKLKTQIPGFFDIVGYLHTSVKIEQGEENIVRHLQLAKTRRILAKDRTDSLGGKLDMATVPMMWDLIQNGNKGE